MAGSADSTLFSGANPMVGTAVAVNVAAPAAHPEGGKATAAPAAGPVAPAAAAAVTWKTILIAAVAATAIASALLVGLAVWYGAPSKNTTTTTTVVEVPEWGQFPTEQGVWTYDNAQANKAANWGTIPDTANPGRVLYPLCAPSPTGTQSPIDIVDAATTPAATVTLPRTYNATYYGLVPRPGGHPGFQVVPHGGMAAWFVDGDRYNLLQLHFHSPSEHTINGTRYPLEAHFVHQNPVTLSLAVFGILFPFTDEADPVPNPFLRSWWDQIYYEHVIDIPDKINVTGLLDDLDEGVGIYRYPGSLTTPPCSEGVKWHVAVSKHGITKGQKITYNYALEMVENYRPTQPLNARTVLKEGVHLPSAPAY